MKNKIKQGFYATELRYGFGIIEVIRERDGYNVNIEYDNYTTRLRSICDENFTDFDKTKKLLENSERSIYLGKP